MVVKINRRSTKALLQKRMLVKALKVRKHYRTLKKYYSIGYKMAKRAGGGIGCEVRKRRKDALPLPTTENVQAFFRRDDVSSALSDARSAKKTADGEMKECRVMNITLECAYRQFGKSIC